MDKDLWHNNRVNLRIGPSLLEQNINVNKTKKVFLNALLNYKCIRFFMRP